MSKILSALALRRATLQQMEALLRDGGGEERQPPPRKFVLSDERRAAKQSAAAPTLAVWTGQDPAERIANTILLCAIRDRAEQVTLEPSDKGVKVSFQAETGVLREQKLPAFALAPIVQHFKALTGDDTNQSAELESVEVEALSGETRVAVDEQFYHLQFSPLATQWARA